MFVEFRFLFIGIGVVFKVCIFFFFDLMVLLSEIIGIFFIFGLFISEYFVVRFLDLVLLLLVYILFLLVIV